MFMRRACVVSLLLVSCFDGGKATGLPCNEDAECGNEKCIDNVCGGPDTTTSSPSTSESESLTTMITGTDTIPPTTSETDPSTTMTTMDTTADTSSSDDGTTGTPVTCLPKPDVATCSGTRIGRAVSSYAVNGGEFGQVISLVAGDFVDDVEARPDLAVLGYDSRSLVIVRNDGGNQWTTTVDRITPESHPDLGLIAPMDIDVGDLACTGTNVFVIAGLGPRMGFIGHDEFGFGAMDYVDINSNSYSVTLADIVTTEGNGALDAVISGNAHVTVLENFGMSFDESVTFAIEDESNFPFAEPWDTEVISMDGVDRIIVPQGEQGDTTPNTPNQVLHSLRVQGDAQPYSLVYSTPPQAGETGFNNPWAMAVGDFNGDGTQDLAVAERHLDDMNQEEGTSTASTIRFLSIESPDDLQDLDTIEVGIGVNSLAAANFDCDEYTDLVIGLGGATPMPAMGGEPQVLFGAASFDDFELVDIGTGGMSPSSRIAIADYDLDGRPEAAIGDFGPGGVVGNRVVIVDIE